MNAPLIGILSVLFAIASMPVPAADASAPAPEKKGQWVKVDKYYRYYRDALAIDRPTGNLICAEWWKKSGKGGLFLSADQGRTFTRADDDKKVRGSPFSGSAIVASPDGGKMVSFSGAWRSTSCYSLDGGKTWTDFAEVIPTNTTKAAGLDFGAMDWESGTVVGFQHESYGGPHVFISTDTGKTWAAFNPPPGAELSPWYSGGGTKMGGFAYGQSGIGVFSAREIVYSHAGGIWRTADGGATWTNLSAHCCVGPVQVFKGEGYWLAKKEEAGKWSGYILATKDKGRTWQQVGTPIANGDSPNLLPPRFGKDEKHIVAAAAAGIVESTDGGGTWKVVVAGYPQKLVARSVSNADCFEYDSLRDIFYVYFFKDDDKEDTPGCTWKYQR